MKWHITNPQTSLRIMSTIILLVGLSSALLIYQTAKDDSSSVQDFENSKMYVHDLELFGGKANVLMNDFRHWFAGLWHGKSLAFTVACISICLSGGGFLVAHHMRPTG